MNNKKALHGKNIDSVHTFISIAYLAFVTHLIICN